MSEHPTLDRRCAIAILFAALAACAVALLAWGPVVLDEQQHRYADTRSVASVSNGWNVLANLPLLIVGLIGLWVERRSVAPRWLKRARQAFHVAVIAGAVFAAAYHLEPTDPLYLLAQAALASGFLVVTAAMLGERVHPVLAGPPVLALATGTALGSALLSSMLGDLRPLLFAQLVPLLMLPTGAITLPGQHTRPRDWFVLLALYGAARLLDLGDATVLQATDGVISGHTLMHLGFALAALWLVYCATRSPIDAGSGEATQRRTSLHTAG